MATGERKDPYRGFNFRVEIDKMPVAGFRECTGLSLTTDTVDYREGSDASLYVRKLTALRKMTGHISLKRGIGDRKELVAWYKNIINGVPDRRNGSVVLQDEQHLDVMRWNFVNGFICKWEGPTLNATSNDVALESIEICAEQIDIE